MKSDIRKSTEFTICDENISWLQQIPVSQKQSKIKICNFAFISVIFIIIILIIMQTFDGIPEIVPQEYKDQLEKFQIQIKILLQNHQVCTVYQLIFDKTLQFSKIFNKIKDKPEIILEFNFCLENKEINGSNRTLTVVNEVNLQNCKGSVMPSMSNFQAKA